MEDSCIASDRRSRGAYFLSGDLGVRSTQALRELDGIGGTFETRLVHANCSVMRREKERSENISPGFRKAHRDRMYLLKWGFGHHLYILAAAWMM